VARSNRIIFAEALGHNAVGANTHFDERIAGRAGATFAKLFGREPSQTIREDLRQLRQVLEAGEIARATPPRRKERL